MDKANNYKPAEPSPESFLELRKRAEKIVRITESLEDISPDEIRHICHELCVHQVELEMQNVNLRQTLEELSEARERYFDLYDMAPVGYCTVSEQGMIMEVNLTAVALLGIDRSELNKESFSRFIFKDDQDIYYLQSRQLLNNGELQAYELRMVKKGGMVFWARLETVAAKDANGNHVCRIVLSDISELKQVEESLQSKTALLEAQVDAAIDGILVVNGNQEIVLINQRVFELFNVPPHVLHIPDRISCAAADAALLKHVVSLTKYPDQFLEKVMYLYKHENETSRDEVELKNGLVLDRYSAPVMGKDGKHYGRIWTFRDITERKRAEELLLASNQIIEGILNAVPCSVFWKDRNLVYLGCNATFARGAGFADPKDIVGKDDYQMGWRNQAELYRGDDRQVIDSGCARLLIEEPQTTPDGNSITLLTSKIPLRNFNGDISGVLGTYMDITSRKQAEDALYALSARQKAILESIPEIIMEVDCNKVYIWANQGGIKFFGDDVVGKDAAFFFEGEQATYDKIQPMFSGDEHVVYLESWQRRKDGEKRLLAWWCRILKDVRGNIQGAISAARDITDRKQAEAELIKAKEKAEESDRLKSAFLANMSHEIRTPMNGILGFAELLKEPHLTGEEQQVYISMIEESGARMLNTVNDIISISKIESGLMEVFISEININEQLEFIYTFFKPEAEQKGIQLSRKNTLSGAEAIIKTDRDKIYAILANLVKNAIKFTDAGSIEFGCEKKGEELEFFVKDTGIGIPRNRQEVVFDRFIQADISDKRAFQGSGLGLSIAKTYVEMLGGKIWLESEEGKGSIFCFTVSCNADLKKESVIKNIVPATAEELKIKDLKILIAEDDEQSEMLLAIATKKLDKEVLKAQTGIAAVAACRSNPDLDLVLMDIRMPEMDGYEATRQIRQFNKKVVIIAQTAYAAIGDREKALAAGCNDYIAKPFTKASLMMLLKKWF